MTDSHSIQKARRSAIKAKTYSPCISCLAHKKSCSAFRPCSSCVSSRKPCVRAVQKIPSETQNYGADGTLLLPPASQYSRAASINNDEFDCLHSRKLGFLEVHSLADRQPPQTVLHSERNETINREDEFSTSILTEKRVLATASRPPRHPSTF